MLDTLKFVQGAVAKKDLVPELTHFHIAGERITGFNGRMAISSPIALDFDAMPQAAPFVAAIGRCEEEVALGLSKAGQLSIRSGTFKAHIRCSNTVFPGVRPAGAAMLPAPGFLGALRALLPFTGEDASRVWAQGVLFQGRSAFATNNVILMEHWLGAEMPVAINVPKTTVQELLRIGEEPISLQVTDTAVTFHFTGGRWLWSLLYETAWPDLSRVLDVPAQDMRELAPEFFLALGNIAPFVEKTGQVWLTGTNVCSHQPGSDEGAVVELADGCPQGIYNVYQFMKLHNVAKSMDFVAYPRPSLFFGDNVRGAIIGIKPQ